MIEALTQHRAATEERDMEMGFVVSLGLLSCSAGRDKCYGKQLSDMWCGVHFQTCNRPR